MSVRTIVRSMWLTVGMSLVSFAGNETLKTLLKQRMETAYTVTRHYKAHDRKGMQTTIRTLKRLDNEIRRQKMKNDDLHDYLLFAQYCIEDIEAAAHEPVNEGNVRYMKELETALYDTDKYVLEKL